MKQNMTQTVQMQMLSQEELITINGGGALGELLGNTVSTVGNILTQTTGSLGNVVSTTGNVLNGLTTTLGDLVKRLPL